MSDWQRVQELFLDAVDLPPAERSSFLMYRCADDADLYVEVQSLLAADLDSGATIESAVQEEAVDLFDTPVAAGTRFGIYSIVCEIGRGGMGTVYLAVRDDREYEEEVALKIVKRGMDTAEVLKRFRYERQILANLTHPFITRLFDGGSTVDGVPYFVMEYVKGKPVDVYCKKNALDIEAKCKLFVHVLEAVAYAHRSLVIHRDLKPANILVVADGTPKLLDFGVAKLLGEDSNSNRTKTGVAQPFTPGYASPEQVLGLPITTATDIYSLGAIFYELLLGKPARFIKAQTPEEIERAVCPIVVGRHTLQEHGLPADLDNIVQMAMRKEPERRYYSALQFSEDIQRFLAGRPVIARQDSIGYRISKFILRNRLLVIATAVVTVSLLTGLGISIFQTGQAIDARAAAEAQRRNAVHQTALAEASAVEESKQAVVADQQRILASDQRAQAQREKAIADQRTLDILDLANRTLFDIHDAIAKLPGSVDARRTLVKTTLDYLTSLEAQAGLDDRMRAALCAAYFKVALMQGNPQGPSLQEFNKAEQSLIKGQALLMPAYKRHPEAPELTLRLVEIRTMLADLDYRAGKEAQAIQMNLDLLPKAHNLFLQKRCSLNCRMQQTAIENSLIYELIGTDLSAALAHANSGIAIARELLKDAPTDETLNQTLGSLLAGGAGVYRVMGDLTHAGEYYRQSIDIRERLLQVDPNNSTIRRNLMIVYGNYATVLGIPWSANLDKPAEARIYAGRCVALARKSVEADANDATAKHDLGMSLSRLGMIDPPADQITQSLATLKEAEALIAPISRANLSSAQTADQVALILEYEAHRLETLGRKSIALEAYRSSLAAIQTFFDAQNPTVNAQYLTDEEGIALLQASSGDSVEALRESRLAVEQAKKIAGQGELTSFKTLVLAKAWATLAITESQLGMSGDAAESATTAIKLWGTITKPGLLLPAHSLMVKTQDLLGRPIR